EGDFINTVLAFRNVVNRDMTFKELLLQMRQTIVEADEHQDYPLELLPELLEMSFPEEDFPIFDVAFLLENIQSKSYFRSFYPPLLFSFLKTGESFDCELQYNAELYEKTTVEAILAHFKHLLEVCLENPGIPISEAEMLSAEEKRRLLKDFNGPRRAYPGDKTIQVLFEEQVERTPQHTAVIFENSKLTYRELNEKANRLARVLRKNGMGVETVAGLMMERSMDMLVALLAVLKAGGAYLPITPGSPVERILYMLENSGSKMLISRGSTAGKLPFTTLEGFEFDREVRIVATGPASPIEDFDSLPVPDRSSIDMRRYKGHIGMASASDCISLQTTRGCPYECLFCHKVWSKKHVFRDAETIYLEIEHYYTKGVRNFSIIDDCFNLNRENSTR
ncbi:MAG: AMP-binding protein, partial [bacterium]|nr:AMP-binding protein [bacterium]